MRWKGTKPTELKINNFFWTIYWSPQPPTSKHGECCLDTKTITIYNGRDKRQVISTLIHEILHALGETVWQVIINLDMDNDDQKEEIGVSLLEPRATGLIIDNPELFEWIKLNTST